MSRSRWPCWLGTTLLALVLALNACAQESTQVIETPALPSPVAQDIAPATSDVPAVTIRFACYSFWQPELEELAADFQAQNPDVRIEFVALEDIVGDDYKKQTLNLVSAADTAYTWVDMSTASQGLLRDLTPFVESDQAFAPEDFFPGTLEAFQWHNRTWALPSQVWMSVLFYDKPMFDAAGVSYPTLTWSLDDFLTAAQRLTLRQGREVTQYGFVDYARQAQDALILPTVGDYRLLGEELPLDAPAVVDAVRWYTDLSLRYQVMPATLQGQERLDFERGLIESGKAAMWGDHWGNYRSYRDYHSRNVGLTPLPTAQGPAVPATMYGYIMSAGTEYPEESWRWLRFLSRRRLLGSEDSQAGQLPARRSVAEQSGYWEQFDQEMLGLMRHAAEHLFFTPHNEAGLQLDMAVWAVFEGKPVEEALAAAQAAVAQYLAQEAQTTPIPVVVATPRPTGAAGATTVTFAPSGGDGETYRALADSFNRVHSDMQVQIVSPGQAPDADCFSGGRSVDDAGTRAELLNLQPLLDADASFSFDDFYPRFLDAFRFQGDLWGLPMQAQVRAIFYNPQLFDAGGVPYPQPGWTLDDFLSQAVALTAGVDDEKQYGFLPLNGDLSDLPVFLTVQGGAPWDEQGRPRFDDPEVVTAMRWYADLALTYGVMPAFPEDLPDGSLTAQVAREALVREGRVAMWTDFTGVSRDGIWPTGVQVGIAPLPFSGQGRAGATDFLYKGLFIAAAAPDPQACWEWLKFVSAHGELLGNLPARRSVLESAAFAGQVGAEAAGTYRASLEYVDVPWPATPEAGTQLRWLYQALADILRGGDPEVALARAQQQAEE